MLVQNTKQNYLSELAPKESAKNANDTKFNEALDESLKTLEKENTKENLAQSLMDQISKALNEKLVDGKTKEKLDFNSLDEQIQKDLISFTKGVMQFMQKNEQSFEILEISVSFSTSHNDTKLRVDYININVSNKTDLDKINIFELLFKDMQEQEKNNTTKISYSYLEFEAFSMQTSFDDQFEKSFTKLFEELFSKKSNMLDLNQNAKIENKTFTNKEKSPLEQILV
ncbi:hypothetical protein DMB92_05890 [Campylobacter sp. MIT 99-7217]|uniref:hypothetical protein n=1 Tax=Campylobacter sp. MIT 99-7217 TaxID=535091 RepID=UPI001158020E|nr:hypothetical protein [Campylobacter sp. MIT 99-7217]TQR31909.1 hypothetical protein DMB92_05890 [Campylobacter sp. MIT 99-7217]